MKIGLLTNGFYRVGQTDFEWVCRWAAEHGFQEIEIGDTVELDRRLFEQIQSKGDIHLEAFLYCKNMLDPIDGDTYVEELKKRILLASQLEIPNVIAFTGFDLTPDTNEKNMRGHRPVADQIDTVVERYKPIIELVEKYGIKLSFENCPMMGNIAYSPIIYQMLFEKMESQKVGITLDPAHFVWTGVDPYREILKFGQRIFHFHGKDCEIDRMRLQETGILATRDWWHYREPGLGELNWNKIVDCLNQVHYTGTISLEHDDTVWNTTKEKVAAGFLIGKKTIVSVPGFLPMGI